MEKALHRYIESMGPLRWLFHTKEKSVVIGQFPNLPLAVGMVALIASRVVSDPGRAWADRIALGSFIVWAVLEIGWGVNPFRRILGGTVLLFLLFTNLPGR